MTSEMHVVLCLLGVWGLGSQAQYAPDEVTDLPGMMFKPNYRQWSGYLRAGPGRFLHYWFVTSQKDPATDPVVLWLNGGPGCSSLDGFLSENGPFHVNDDGATLYDNPYSWNKIANVLYLESPAGVGYSYSDQTYTIDDNQVAEDNYEALQNFFTKFPNFTQNEFFIIGESYGGIYAPTLSLRVATGEAKINFKGFAVGNGLSSFALNDQSLIYFGYYHGLFGEDLWRDLNINCCNMSNCKFYNSSSEACQTMVNVAFNIVYETGLNEYALYLDCEGSHRGYEFAMRHLFKMFKKRLHTYKLPGTRTSTPSLGGVPPCINSTAQTNWLNRGDVRKALHIPDVLPPWDICSDSVGAQYKILYSTMKDVYLKLLSLGLRSLVYNGDTDMACNFLGDQWFVEDLGIKATTKFQTWLYEDQIAGFYQEFANITFLTVKGAGHMVPQWAPGPALQMFQSFITNTSY